MSADPPPNLELFLALALAASKGWSIVQREFRAAGVDTGSWGLLFHIDAADAPTPSRLAAETGVGPTTIRDQLQSLVDRGLVERRPNPLDARSYTVALTRTGKRDLARGLAASKRAAARVQAHGDLEPLRERLLSFV